MPPTMSAGFLAASPVLHTFPKADNGHHATPPQANRAAPMTPRRANQQVSTHGAAEPATAVNRGAVYHYVGAVDHLQHRQVHPREQAGGAAEGGSQAGGRSQSQPYLAAQQGPHLVPSYVALTPRQVQPSHQERYVLAHEPSTPRGSAPASRHEWVDNQQAFPTSGRSQSGAAYFHAEHYASARTASVTTPRGGGGGSRSHTPDPQSRATTPHSYLPSIEIPDYRPVTGQSRHAAAGAHHATPPGSRPRSASSGADPAHVCKLRTVAIQGAGGAVPCFAEAAHSSLLWDRACCWRAWTGWAGRGGVEEEAMRRKQRIHRACGWLCLTRGEMDH